MMFTGVPNMVSVFGYINASWTLRADLTAESACRVLEATGVSFDWAVQEAGADVMDARSGRLPRLSVAGSWTRNVKKPVMFLPADMAAAFGGVPAMQKAMELAKEAIDEEER